MKAKDDSVGVLAGSHPCRVIFGPMKPQDGQDAKAGIRDVRIRGSRLLLRALQPSEIEEEWRAMVTADPMVIAELPEEAGFKARLQRSGHLEDGWLDLAIDLDGVSIGRIRTFVPPGRALPPGTFELGIELREKARNQGYGREALALLTDWLFEHAAALGSRGVNRSRQCGDANGLAASRLDARRIADRVRP